MAFAHDEGIEACNDFKEVFNGLLATMEIRVRAEFSVVHVAPHGKKIGEHAGRLVGEGRYGVNFDPIAGRNDDRFRNPRKFADESRKASGISCSAKSILSRMQVNDEAWFKPNTTTCL